MAEGKYGRLYTEQDVGRLITENGGPPDDADVAAILDEFEGTFPPDEPLFLLRAQDKAAPRAIATMTEREEEYGGYGDYYSSAVIVGAEDEFLDRIAQQAREMYEWQRANPDRVKVPD